jgi:ribosomal protein L23
MENFGILKANIFTEKSNALLSHNQQYGFVVNEKANKEQIARGFEMKCNVKLIRVTNIKGQKLLDSYVEMHLRGKIVS